MATFPRSQLLTAGNIVDAVSMAASITSSVLDVAHCRAVSLQIHAASNTHVGTWVVQFSNDGSNWVTDTLLGTISASNGSAEDDMIAIELSGQRYLRMTYTASSGAGTATVTASTLRQR